MRFRYTVEFYDEFDKTMHIDRGYIVADSYKDAVDKLDMYYGADNIERMFLAPETDDHVIVLEENMAEFDVNWEGPAINTGF